MRERRRVASGLAALERQNWSRLRALKVGLAFGRVVGFATSLRGSSAFGVVWLGARGPPRSRSGQGHQWGRLLLLLLHQEVMGTGVPRLHLLKVTQEVNVVGVDLLPTSTLAQNVRRTSTLKVLCPGWTVRVRTATPWGKRALVYCHWSG